VPAGGSEISLNWVDCVSTTRCFGVGAYINKDAENVTLAEMSDGSKWALQATPSPAGDAESFLNAVACTSATSCQAVGYTIGSKTDALAEGWTGTKWVNETIPDPSGDRDNYLYGAACSSTKVCTAVGYSTKTLTSANLTLADGWNGTSWALDTTPDA
jgi:hypothetical protein